MRFELYKVYEDHELDRVYYEHGEIIGSFHHEPCRTWQSYELDLTHCADEEFLAFVGVISVTSTENVFDLTKFLEHQCKGSVDYYTINFDSLMKDINNINERIDSHESRFSRL